MNMLRITQSLRKYQNDTNGTNNINASCHHLPIPPINLCDWVGTKVITEKTKLLSYHLAAYYVVSVQPWLSFAQKMYSISLKLNLIH